MDWSIWIPVLVSIVTTFGTIITVVIQTNAKAKETLAEVKKSQTDAEEKAKQREVWENEMLVNDYRTHLLLLLSNYRNNIDEIIICAKKYFVDLDGDSFVLPLFNNWLEEQEMTKPEWFLLAMQRHPKPEEVR